MKNKIRKKQIEKLYVLLKDLDYLERNLSDIIDKLKDNADVENENVMKLCTLEFNDAVHDINIFYKEILDLCIDLYFIKYFF